MDQILGYIREHLIELIGLLVSYFSFVLPIQQYIGQRKLEEKDKRFVNYHKLIKELVSGDTGGSVMMDRQIAIVFELRNYPEYYELSKRILEGLKAEWYNITSGRRLLAEMDLTLEVINRKL